MTVDRSLDLASATAARAAALRQRISGTTVAGFPTWAFAAVLLRRAARARALVQLRLQAGPVLGARERQALVRPLPRGARRDLPRHVPEHAARSALLGTAICLVIAVPVRLLARRQAEPARTGRSRSRSCSCRSGRTSSCARSAGRSCSHRRASSRTPLQNLGLIHGRLDILYTAGGRAAGRRLQLPAADDPAAVRRDRPGRAPAARSERGPRRQPGADLPPGDASARRARDRVRAACSCSSR